MTTSQATIKGDWYSRMKRSVEKLRRRPLLGSLHTIRIFLKKDIFFFAVLAFRLVGYTAVFRVVTQAVVMLSFFACFTALLQLSLNLCQFIA